MKVRLLFFAFTLSTLFWSCESVLVIPRDYEAENIIVIVMDGPRYSETWGDITHQNITHLYNDIAKQGVVYTGFYNNGPTYTLSGHTSITTGYYQEINNSGQESPNYPSFFQYWLTNGRKSNESAWIIASKDKIEILNNCKNVRYKDRGVPSTNCGINGINTGYRDDSITFKTVIKTLTNYQPKLLLINLKEPDNLAHKGNWSNYLKGIKQSDEYIFQIWNYIQSSPFYKDKTALFITNDHGRHLDGVAGGFSNHGDGCDGCRRLFLCAVGPDFKSGTTITTRRELIDITATIAEILHLQMNYSNGKIMYELFK